MEMISDIISSKIILVMLFICCDIITGWIKAFCTGTYNSSVMRKGLWHKLAEILSVGFGYLCDYALPLIGVELPVMLSSALVAYVVIMECSSVVENVGSMSPALGSFLSKWFEKVGNDDEV